MRKKDIEYLDKIDLFLARKALKLSSRSTRCLILLELGIIPIEFIIKRKRIIYLHTLLTSDISSLARNVFIKQWEKPIRGDFACLVKQDMEEYKT